MMYQWRTMIFVACILLALPLVASEGNLTVYHPVSNFPYHEGGTNMIFNFTIYNAVLKGLDDCKIEYNGKNTSFSCYTAYPPTIVYGDLGDTDLPTDKQVGERISVNLDTIWVFGFNKSSGSDATRGLIQTIDGINLSVCKFAGDYCAFNSTLVPLGPGQLVSKGVNLSGGEDYFILADGNGSSVTHKRLDGTASHPYVNEFFNFTTSVNNFIADATHFNVIGMVNVSERAGNFTASVYPNHQFTFNVSDFNNRTFIVTYDEIGFFRAMNYSWNYSVWVNEYRSNQSIIDLAKETFIANVTWGTNFYNSIAAALNYNGTRYSSTKTTETSDTAIFTSSISIPGLESDSIQNYFWNFTLTNTTGTNYINGTRDTVGVNVTNLSICGASPQNVQFINFTFLDEEDSTDLTAKIDASNWFYWIGSASVNKTYSYSNTSYLDSFEFCISPPHLSYNVDLEFKYSNTSYPQRTFRLDSTQLTNTTTAQVLYLLNSDDGIYSTIQVIDQGGAPIGGVYMTIERQFDGIWTVIGAGVTDDAGAVTFWVNPNYNHRITAEKTGYVTKTVIIQPTQSVYTLTLATSTDVNGTYTPDIEGLLWEVSPHSGSLDVGTVNFNVTITSSEYNLEGCKFDLVNVSNISQVLATGSDATNSTYCYINYDYVTVDSVNLFGILYVDTTNTPGYVVIDADFKFLPTNKVVEDWRTISSFFQELRDLSEFGSGNQALFSRLMFFFLVSTIFMGIFTYFTGSELQNPGSMITIIIILVFFASAGGFLDINIGSTNLQSSVFSQYAFFLITLFFGIAFYLTVIRRANE